MTTLTERAEDALVRRIEGEYSEMPGLSLTEAQAERLWDLDAPRCRTVLVRLQREHFLRRTRDGRYVMIAESA